MAQSRPFTSPGRSTLARSESRSASNASPATLQVAAELGRCFGLRRSLGSIQTRVAVDIMKHRSFQFGLAALVWLVVFAAFNCWLFTLGSWGRVVAVVIDKHVIVAYLCMIAQVDRRRLRTPLHHRKWPSAVIGPPASASTSYACDHLVPSESADFAPGCQSRSQRAAS